MDHADQAAPTMIVATERARHAGHAIGRGGNADPIATHAVMTVARRRAAEGRDADRKISNVLSVRRAPIN